jgi:hypothetical protein
VLRPPCVQHPQERVRLAAADRLRPARDVSLRDCKREIVHEFEQLRGALLQLVNAGSLESRLMDGVDAIYANAADELLSGHRCTAWKALYQKVATILACYYSARKCTGRRHLQALKRVRRFLLFNIDIIFHDTHSSR